MQEALTNVAKHAPGAATHVRLAYRRSALRISVLNDAPPKPEAPPAAEPAAELRDGIRHGGTGLGLIGMRERAAICGADLTAGPRPGGGSSVILRLPSSSEVDCPEAARLSSGP